MSTDIAVIFEDHPEYGVLDFNKLRHKISREIATDQELKKFLAKRNNIYAKKYRPKVFFRIASQSYTWQVDLMVYKDRIFFAAIEINSRFGYLEPLKRNATGSAKEWLPCLKRLLDLKRPTYKIIGDAQFENSHECKRLCTEKHVKLYTFVSKEIHKFYGNKLAYIDRFIRTMKWYDTKLNRADIKIETRMQKLVDLYNNSSHSYLKKYVKKNTTTHLTPVDVIDDIELLTEIHTDNRAYNHDLRAKLFGAFKIGDYVRHVLPRDERTFRQKEGVMLSELIYKITSIGNTGYYLTNEQTDETLERQYKPSELKIAVGGVRVRQRAHPKKSTALVKELHDLGAPRLERRKTRLHVNVQQVTDASRVQAKIANGSKIQALWRDGRRLKWFKGKVEKVHKKVGRDADGQVIYVDIKWDDGTESKNFRLFEDYYGRTDVESGWTLS